MRNKRTAQNEYGIHRGGVVKGGDAAGDVPVGPWWVVGAGAGATACGSGGRSGSGRTRVVGAHML